MNWLGKQKITQGCPQNQIKKKKEIKKLLYFQEPSLLGCLVINSEVSLQMPQLKFKEGKRLKKKQERSLSNYKNWR